MVQGDGQQVVAELVAQVRGWHDAALKAGGGAPGEHTDRLLGACGRTSASAFGRELFPTDFDKAAALFHAIVSDHPFADGNKRTATIAAILFLAGHNAIDDVSTLQLRMIGDLALETASTQLTVEDVSHWLHRILDP